MTNPIGVKELAQGLGLGRRYTARLITRGMPRDLEGARHWRDANIELRTPAAPAGEALDLDPAAHQLLCAIEGAFFSLPVVLRRRGMEEDAVAGVTADMLASVEADLRDRRLTKAEIGLAMRCVRELQG